MLTPFENSDAEILRRFWDADSNFKRSIRAFACNIKSSNRLLCLISFHTLWSLLTDMDRLVFLSSAPKTQQRFTELPPARCLLALSCFSEFFIGAPDTAEVPLLQVGLHLDLQGILRLLPPRQLLQPVDHPLDAIESCVLNTLSICDYSL